jgi:hypothetical protein
MAMDPYLAKLFPQFYDSNGFIAHRAYYRQTAFLGHLRELKCEKDWIAKVCRMLRKTSSECISSCDRNNWRVYPIGPRTWSGPGADGIVVGLPTNTKGCLTDVCSITAARLKLPIILIMAGKTAHADT